MKKPGNAGQARQEGGCRVNDGKRNCRKWRRLLSKAEKPPEMELGGSEVWTERMLTTLETGVKGGKNAYFIEQGLFTMAVAHAPSVPPWTPLTGEPDAGEPHVRFGGRGGSNQ